MVDDVLHAGENCGLGHGSPATAAPAPVVERVIGDRPRANQEGTCTTSLTQYYTATTLDGCIADANDSLDWLLRRESEDEGPLRYRDFIAGVGAMAMASTTYDWILGHEFSGKDQAEWTWPYTVPCWVFTHRKLAVVPNARIELVSGDVAPVHEAMVDAASLPAPGSRS
jgi:hypothetical protein